MMLTSTMHKWTLTPSTTTMYGVCTLTPLAPKSLYPNTRTDVFDLIFRVILLSVIGIMAIWANHEVAKGFSVTIVNDAGKYSLARKRFSLFYESNDKATRVMLNSSQFIENLLFPNQEFRHNIKKQINGVTLRLSPTTLPSIVSVNSPKPYEYLINLCPSLMETSNNEAMILAIFQGMARVWLWDENVKTQTPPDLLNGMVEYITILAGFTPHEVSNSSIIPSEKIEICWKNEDPRKVAGFLRYIDNGGRGDIIRRLNDEIRKGWHDRVVGDALGIEPEDACASYDMMMKDHHLSSSI